MTQISVKYNPYRLTTEIKVNGNDISEDSGLQKYVRNHQRMQEWIGEFPEALKMILNTSELDVEFCGSVLDWDDFEEAFKHAKAAGIIRNLSLRFRQAKTDEDVQNKIIKVFNDLREGPIDEFRDQKLKQAFDNVSNAVFPINVIATMSSGKSTLVNALLRQKLMPSKNAACTAVITEILDNDMNSFKAEVFDQHEEKILNIEDLTYQIMDELNSDTNVYKICAEGDIPFIDANTTALKLIDTPGPNNAQNQNHKNTTFRAIEGSSNNLILYVLNGTQLGTNDDDSLLSYVSEQIQKGGKQAHDRFLFVVNKMDSFNPEEESIEDVLANVRRYLSDHKIDDPQLFPCSAYTALNIRTHLNGIEIENLTRNEIRALPSAARDTLNDIDTFNEFESMHLERYSTLCPSAQHELNDRLARAEERGDTKEQALIHSGICSLEAAITAYVKKYANTKKIKDLVETFEDVLKSNEVITRAKTVVATDEAAAKECAERAAAVMAKIQDGEEAATFKKRVDELNPIPMIKAKADSLMDEAALQVTEVFKYYGDVITSKNEAKRLVSQFTTKASDVIAKLTANLESAINTEVIENSKKLLEEYQQKLTSIDESVESTALDFSTADLIKGAMSNMLDMAQNWKSADFASETVDDVGEVSYEESEYYEKVGEEVIQVKIGSHKEKVGTETVTVGTHKEKVGTRKVKNSEREGFLGFFKFWKPKYVNEDIIEEFEDTEERDIFKDVDDYEDQKRDVFEKRIKREEKYSVETSELQTRLVVPLRAEIDKGVEDSISYAENRVKSIKNSFKKEFEMLDEIIKKKYEEFDKCANDEEKKQQELDRNKAILEWIENSVAEINEILDI